MKFEQRVHAVWSVPDEEHAHWFDDVLDKIRRVAKAGGSNVPKLSLGIYATRAKSATPPIKTGRPKMAAKYDKIASTLRDEACLVFVCGPKLMVNENWDLSTRKSRAGMTFHFHHETFDF